MVNRLSFGETVSSLSNGVTEHLNLLFLPVLHPTPLTFTVFLSSFHLFCLFLPVSSPLFLHFFVFCFLLVFLFPLYRGLVSDRCQDYPPFLRRLCAPCLLSDKTTAHHTASSPPLSSRCNFLSSIMVLVAAIAPSRQFSRQCWACAPDSPRLSIPSQARLGNSVGGFDRASEAEHHPFPPAFVGLPDHRSFETQNTSFPSSYPIG